MKLIGDVKNKNVFIPDDIIDSGNTLCGAAKLLKKKGAKKLFCYDQQYSSSKVFRLRSY